MTSHYDGLSVRQLIAFLFLVEQDKSLGELKGAITQPGFMSLWRTAEERFRKLVKYYPDEDEEKHYFVATLEAVHDLDPFSGKTLDLRDQYLPLIQVLLDSR